MISVQEGEQYRSRITGAVYDVKKVVNQWVVLEAAHEMRKVVTELNALNLFYDKEPNRDEGRG